MDEPRAKQEVEEPGPARRVGTLHELGLGRSPFRGLRQRVLGVLLRQQNGKGRTQLTSTTWQQRAGSASTRQAEVREKARLREPTLAEVVAATAGRVAKTFKSRLQRLVRHTVGQARG